VASVMPAMLFGFPWALLFGLVVVRMILRRILRRPLDRQMAFKWGVGVGILAVLFLHLPMAFVSLISQFGVEVENGSKPDAVFHWLKPILSVATLFLISIYTPADMASGGAMFLWWGIFLVYCGFCGIFVRAFIAWARTKNLAGWLAKRVTQKFERGGIHQNCLRASSRVRGTHRNNGAGLAEYRSLGGDAGATLRMNKGVK